MIETFTFADYLDYIEQSINAQSDSTKKENGLKEVLELRSHSAGVTTMQRHLKNYRVLIDLKSRFCV